MSKSRTMRGRFEDGWTVAQVAKALKVDCDFDYGVHRRWKESTRCRDDGQETGTSPHVLGRCGACSRTVEGNLVRVQVLASAPQSESHHVFDELCAAALDRHSDAAVAEGNDRAKAGKYANDPKNRSVDSRAIMKEQATSPYGRQPATFTLLRSGT